MEGAPVTCGRRGSRDERSLRRLKLEYLSRVEISEQILCVHCLRLYVVTESNAFERLLQPGE